MNETAQDILNLLNALLQQANKDIGKASIEEKPFFQIKIDLLEKVIDAIERKYG